MKKSLLLLGAALLMSASAMAQGFTRVYPSPTEFHPTYEPASSFEPEETLYLWNDKYGGFYTNVQKGGDGYWGTRAAACDTIGTEVVFTRTNPGGDDMESTTDWEDDMYLLVSYVNWTGKNANMCTFVANWAAIWTDNNGETNRYFHVKQAGDFLRISPAQAMENEMPVEWDNYNFCIRPLSQDADKRVYLNDPTYIDATEAVGEDWAIVKPETYETWIAENKEKVYLYTAAKALRDAVEQYVNNTAEYDGIASFFTEQYNAYNNTAATVESLNEAAAKIPAIVMEFQESRATPDNPRNYTAALVNPGFDNGSTGWTNVGAVNYSCAENFNMNFDVYQTVTDLPEGVYRVSNQAFYRAGGHGADPEYNNYVANPAGDRNAILYGRSQDYGEVSTRIKRAIDEAQPSSLNGDDSMLPSTQGLSIDGYYVPNSMAGARVWFDQNHYQNELFLGVSGKTDVLTVGFKKNVLIANDWVIYDNFQLWYYGNTKEAYQLWANELLKVMPYEDPYEFQSGEFYYGQPEYNIYSNVYQGLSKADSKEEIVAAIAGMSAAIDTIEQSIAIYQQYVDEVDGFSDWELSHPLDPDTEEYAALSDYFYGDASNTDSRFPNGNAQYIMRNEPVGDLSVEQMKAELAFVAELKANAAKAGLIKGADLTYLIVNPDFELTPAGTGWTMGYNQTGNNNLRGGRSSNYCAEVYESDFDLYQEIESSQLKDGLYKVTVRAFQRTAANDPAWAAWVGGEAKVTTEVYLDDFATPVANLQAVQYKTQLGNAVGHDIGGTTYYTLNNMDGASDAFSLKDDWGLTADGTPDANYYQNFGSETMVRANFKQEVFGLVNGGKLKLGIRSYDNTQTAGRWTLWDKFELTFMDKDVEGIYEVLDDYYTRIDDILSDEEYTEKAGSLDQNDLMDERDAVETAAPEVTDKVEYVNPATGEVSYNSDQLYNLLLGLVAKYNRVKNGAKLYDTMNQTLEALQNYLLDNEGVLAGNPVMDAINWSDDILNDYYYYQDKKLEDYEAVIAKAEQYMEQAQTAVMEAIGDWDGASQDKPLDVTSLIVNPDYANNDNQGWSGTAPGLNFNSAEVYNATFDYHQTIRVPRSGYYLLTVRAFERLGSATNDYSIYSNHTYGDNIKTYMYATVGDETYSHHVSQCSKHAQTQEQQGNFASGSTWAQAVADTDLYLVNNMEGASSMFYYYLKDPTNIADWDTEGKPIVKNEAAGYYYNPLLITMPTEGGEITIGIKKDQNLSTGWCIWSDWKLWYYGTDASVLDGIAEVNPEAVTAPVRSAIYTLSGAKVQNMQRGINIVKTVDANGNVKVQKIFVK